MQRQVHSHRVIIQPPLKDEKFGVFHPKLMLLFYGTSMRVVIGSANMVSYFPKGKISVLTINIYTRSVTIMKILKMLCLSKIFLN